MKTLKKTKYYSNPDLNYNKVDYRNQGGLAFNGVNEYISFGNVTAFDVSSQFTISFIAGFNNFNSVVSVNPKLLNKISVLGGGAYRGWLVQFTNDGKLNFSAYDNAANIRSFTTVNTLIASALYYVSISVNTVNGATFYINGELQEKTANNTGSLGSILNTAPLQLSGWNISPLAGLINGTIYDLNIVNIAMTEKQARSNYSRWNGAAQTPVINCDFNQKTGTILKDFSPNLYNGNLINFSNTTLGGANSWKDKNNNSITQY